MAKVNIKTYSTYDFYLDGKPARLEVKKIYSEEEVANISKEVSVFEKYSSKKTIKSAVKTECDEMSR